LVFLGVVGVVEGLVGVVDGVVVLGWLPVVVGVAAGVDPVCAALVLVVAVPLDPQPVAASVIAAASRMASGWWRDAEAMA
jgi:hypothetical protein